VSRLTQLRIAAKLLGESCEIRLKHGGCYIYDGARFHRGETFEDAYDAYFEAVGCNG
jgi:hypothetical protein